MKKFTSHINEVKHRKNLAVTRAKKFLATAYCNLLISLANFHFIFGKKISEGYKRIWPYTKLSWFDHRFDYLRGVDNIYWLERGFYANSLIKKGDSVLDIGCGDGIYSGLFYSKKARKVDAIDINEKAIVNAKKYYKTNNVSFYCIDFLSWMPRYKYNQIFMFAVLEHFTPEDGQEVLKKIRSILKKDGILLGSTPLFKNKGGHNFEHQNEFGSETEVKSFLNSNFSNAKTFISDWPNRTECYFECKK